MGNIGEEQPEIEVLPGAPAREPGRAPQREPQRQPEPVQPASPQVPAPA